MILLCKQNNFSFNLNQSKHYTILGALALVPSWFTYIKANFLLPNLHSLIPTLQTSSTHNFKIIVITHPSFDNNIKRWTVFWSTRPRTSLDLRDLFQQARFLFHFNRCLIPFHRDSAFIKQTNNIITRYIDFSESQNELLCIQQQLSDVSTLTFILTDRL
ncbi:hypothetical protein RhiirA4_478024 [Rhizophagus irregularis]|uniref:Uncharacterized protein n=1 Tax=Rhizophagus irregularis TaxID=588596 RepID=A0A2I1HE50_9GLOM|nr:hypothetical protein RhiirA4_478024 [Rhizophagus irregularis]